jgi:hypothetical protein
MLQKIGGCGWSTKKVDIQGPERQGFSRAEKAERLISPDEAQMLATR